MDSLEPFSPSFKASTVVVADQNSNNVDDSKVITQQAPPVVGAAAEGFIGILEVFIRHARDIHNVCIYHKQDVYAKLCLTNDPEVTVSSQIINGGGKSPVFNDTVRLNVRTIYSSLKCEIYMLSRVKNYLQDQLLGFALVPLSDVVLGHGKLVQEFSLSSTDLFHSPAGFVHLSISFFGSSPEVMAIPAPPSSVMADSNLPDLENEEAIPCELDKIEFPDLKIVNENQLMVSEYFGIPSTTLNSQNPESLITSENGDCSYDNAGTRVVESFSTTDNSLDSVGGLKQDNPLRSGSTNGSPAPIPATSQCFSNPSGITESPPTEKETKEIADGEADSSNEISENAFVPPVINIHNEPEQTVVQQEIVDMYMKSMQQFTESLAKMKLPMDLENNSINTEDANANKGSEQKLQTSKATGSRVFYGSRAFF